LSNHDKADEMSPRVFKEGDFVFWFHSYDVQHENRASIHVGKSSQNDATDAKIWLAPEIEVARAGRSLTQIELVRAIRLIEVNYERVLEAWHDHRRRTY
jgi:hypothetical protein